MTLQDGSFLPELTAFAGRIRIIECLEMVGDGEPIEVRRGWRERLFSRPWRPFKRTRNEVPKVPMKDVYRLARGVFLMHPAVAAELRKHLAKDEG
jgi:hypothetical protein